MAPLLDHVLHVCMFCGVELDVVLGQDLHDGPDLQPPLCPGDAVSVKTHRRRLHAFTSDDTERTDGRRGDSLKVCVFLQLGKRLEHERSLPHAQHAGGVWGVGKDTT